MLQTQQTTTMNIASNVATMGDHKVTTSTESTPLINEQPISSRTMSQERKKRQSVDSTMFQKCKKIRLDDIKKTSKTQDNLGESSKFMAKDDIFNEHVFLPQSSTENKEKKFLTSKVNTDTTDYNRIPNAATPATSTPCSSVKFNEITLPSLDKLKDTFEKMALKEIKESKIQNILIIKDFSEPHCSVMFTDRAIERFTAANISLEEINKALKHTALDDGLDPEKPMYNSCAKSYYIDNESIIEEYDKMRDENKESVEHLFRYDKNSSNTSSNSRLIAQEDISRDFLPEVLYHNNCYSIDRDNGTDEPYIPGYFPPGTKKDVQEMVTIIYNTDQYVLYSTIKHYHKLINLFSKTNSSSSPEIINHLRQVT